MTKKTIISFLLLMIILASFSLVNAQVTHVECAKDSDCGNGEVCQKIGSPTNWYCVSTAGEITPTANNVSNETDYTPIIIAASIIGVCIVLGFIILAIILRRKHKRL